MAQTTRLQAVGEEEIVEPEVRVTTAPAKPRASQAAMTNLLVLSLRALSQRAVVALGSLVDLALIASAFWLVMTVIAQPTTLQLVALAGYSLFIIVALWMRRGS